MFSARVNTKRGTLREIVVPPLFETTQGPSLFPHVFSAVLGARRTWEPLDYPIGKVRRFEALPPRPRPLLGVFSPHEKCRHWDDVKATTCSGNTKIGLACECELLILIFGSHVPITLFCICLPGVFLNVSTRGDIPTITAATPLYLLQRYNKLS